MALYIHLPNGLALDPADVISITGLYDTDGALAAIHVWTTYDRSAPTWTFAGAQLAPALAALRAHDLEIDD